MNLSHFSFAEPQWLLALLVLPVLLAYAFVVRRSRSRFTISFTNLAVLAGVARKRRSSWWRRLPIVLLALALATAIAALAQPRVQLNNADRTATIVLLVDVSQSMEAIDIAPTRLQAAVEAMHDFVGELPAADRVGLMTFSDKVETLNDPTTNHTAVNSSIDTLAPQGGTALGTGIAAAIKLVVTSLAAIGIHHVPGTYLPAAIVLESDGAQNRGTISPFQAGELAKVSGVRIFGVALGKPYGYIIEGSGFNAFRIDVPPDPSTVGFVSRESGGESFTATDTPKLLAIYRHLGHSVGQTPQETDVSSWFDIAAAVLLVAGVAAARARGAALP